MNTRTWRSQHSDTRTGLTLVELVLAIAGCSVLMVLIASLLTSQANTMTRCQHAVVSTRASLRLSQWLRQDLSLLSSLNEQPQLVSLGSSVGERVLQHDFQLADTALQLFGSAESLAISRFDGESHLICTVWSDATASRKAIPYLSSDQQVRFQPQAQLAPPTLPATHTSGVQRMQFLVNKQAVELQRTSFAEAASTIRFRYFDGSRWQDRWDSHEQGCLPQAVEFIVQFHGDIEPQRFIHAIVVDRVKMTMEFGT